MYQCTTFTDVKQEDLLNIYKYTQTPTPFGKLHFLNCNEITERLIRTTKTHKDLLTITFGQQQVISRDHHLDDRSLFVSLNPLRKYWIYCLTRFQVETYNLNIVVPESVEDAMLVLPSAINSTFLEIKIAISTNWKSSLTITTPLASELFKVSFICGLDIANNGNVFPVKRVTSNGIHSIYLRPFSRKPLVDTHDNVHYPRGELRCISDGRNWTIHGETMHEFVDETNNPTFPTSSNLSSSVTLQSITTFDLLEGLDSVNSMFNVIISKESFGITEICDILVDIPGAGTVLQIVHDPLGWTTSSININATPGRYVLKFTTYKTRESGLSLFKIFNGLADAVLCAEHSTNLKLNVGSMATPLPIEIFFTLPATNSTSQIVIEFMGHGVIWISPHIIVWKL
jgi:hypothetical protein